MRLERPTPKQRILVDQYPVWFAFLIYCYSQSHPSFIHLLLPVLMFAMSGITFSERLREKLMADATFKYLVIASESRAWFAARLLFCGALLAVATMAATAKV